MSEIFRLSSSDFIKSAISAVFVAVIVALAGIVGPDFDVFNTDWFAVGKMVINVAVATFIGRMSEKLLTDKEGTVHLGAVKIKTK